MPYLVIFDQKSWVLLAQNSISVLEFVFFQSLSQTKKSLNLGLKTRDLGIFELDFKNIIYLKQAPSNLFDCKISWKN